MAGLVVFGVFALAAVASAFAAVTGYRGQVCDPDRGYEVPARVAADAALTEKANRLVAHWYSGATALSLAPLYPLYAQMSGPDPAGLSLPTLLALAGYGLLVGALAVYPVERIKRLDSSGPSGTEGN
ncbi:hypothetical protein ACIPUC_01500 [Streptomyces sp. LARHCF249]